MSIVVEIAPLPPGAGTRPTLRFADGDDARLTRLNDQRWWPGIVTAPDLSLDGWDGEFSAQAVLASAGLGIDPYALRKADPASPSYRWAGAPVRIYEGEAGAPFSAWRLRFAGLITDYSVDANARFSMTAQVDGEPFEAQVLSASYAGTGGAEGGADLKGKPKPMVFGFARNVEPILVDEVNVVFQVHGYGSIQAINAVYERAADFSQGGGASVGDYPTYAALIAATIKEGSYGTCLAQGLFRLGAPPAGLITADVSGDNAAGFVRSTAAVIRQICSIAGVPTARIDLVSLAALNDARPTGSARTLAEMPINLYVTAQIKLIDLIQSLVRPCNAQALISWTGQLRVVRFGVVPASTITLDVPGRARPPVLSCQEIRTSPPYHRIEMRGARAWRPHGKDEIAFTAALTERGRFDPAMIYREGDIVDLADGSRWLYVGLIPGSAAPPDPVWASLSPPTKASDIDYADGSSLEDRRPAQKGADKTSENTSKDTNAVGGQPAGDVLVQIATAKAIFERLDAETIPTINQAIVDANTAIANARNDAAEAVDEVAELLAQARADLTRADQILKERVDALVVEGGGYDDSGLRAAIERIDAALVVGDKAVAQQINAVKASSSGGMANRNPAFADLSARNGAVTTMMASRWGYWSSPPTDASRQPGTVSEWAWLMRADAAQRTGLSSAYFPFEPGWAVLDVAWEQWDGLLSGAGVHLSLADATGAEIGIASASLAALLHDPDQPLAGSAFKPVRRTRLIKLEGTFRQIALVGALNFEIHGPLAYKQLAWHHIGLRRASDAEIKAGRASAELIPALDARVTREVTALADTDRALARDVAEVRAGYEAADQAMNGRVDETNTAFARADKVLADKQVVLEASARAVPTMLNRNAGFSDWPDGQYLPSMWAGSTAPNSISRVPGKVGRWAMRQAFGPGQGAVDTFIAATGDAVRWPFDDPMVWDSGLNVAPGMYVLSWDFELESGQVVGSGAYVGGFDVNIAERGRRLIDFAAEKNADGSEIGIGVVGRRYQGSRLLDLTHPGIRLLRIHPMTSYSTFGRGVFPYKTLIWHLFGVRPATPEEIAANKADAEITNLTARADSAVAALVDLETNKATVQSVNTLRAEAGEAIGLVDDRVDVVAERERVTARSLETLSGEYGDTKLEVTRQAGIIGEKLGQNIAYFRTTVAAGSAIADMTAFADAATGVSAFRFKAGQFLFEGDVIVDGSVTSRKFNGASMAREARVPWTGSITPASGQTITVPWSLTLSSIPPLGRFIYEYTYRLDTNAGTSVPGGMDARGRPVTIHYVEDGGGLFVQAVDGQGNVYSPRPNASDRVLATTDFTPNFTAFVRMGSRNETIDDGDNVQRFVAASYTLTRIDLKVTWVAI